VTGELSFQSISPADVPAAASVFVECFSAPPWNEPWTLAAAARRLGLFAAAPSFRGVLAIQEENPVAIALGQIEGWLRGSLFLLQEMCVVPSQQRVGVGRRMLDHLLSTLATADDVHEVYLLTDAASAAESFYLGHGFNRSARKIVLSRRVG
jgi:GNAT superfamily N-acetyltransferase